MPTSIGEGFENYYDSEEVRVKELDGNLYNNGRDGQYERDSLLVHETPKKPLNVRTIVIGTNALKSSPKDFSSQKVYQNVEEVLDFAVVEVNFDNETQAKKMTQDYYNAAQEKIIIKAVKKTSSILKFIKIFRKKIFTVLVDLQHKMKVKIRLIVMKMRLILLTDAFKFHLDLIKM